MQKQMVGNNGFLEKGGKGHIFPDQRRKYKDSKTGHTVWQMTNTPGKITHAQYFTQSATTPDGRWLIYGSNRSGVEGQGLNLFKMDLQTGKSIQLTDSKNCVPRWSCLSPNGKEVYFIEDLNRFRVVNIETLKERDLCVIEECKRPHQISVSPDNKYFVSAFREEAVDVEDTRDFDVLARNFLARSAIFVVRTDTGEVHRLLDGNTPRGHVQYCPADSSLILYAYQGPWYFVQRVWLINADGTNNRPIFLQTNYEGIRHEFWSESGRSIYATCVGGRQPQGLWAIDLDGTNERCVLAGSCLAHGTANAQEDRFVVDELYHDCKTGLWMARKGCPEPELLCQTGVSWEDKEQEYHPHPRFLPNGTGVSFTSAMSGSPEVYIVEV